jgi:hypothetical protein
MKHETESNAGSAGGRKEDSMNTISIKLTQDNGSTREVRYEIAGDRERAHILFNTLRDAAWAASAYAQPEELSEQASYFAPKERTTTDDVMGRSLLDRVVGK